MSLWWWQLNAERIGRESLGKWRGRDVRVRSDGDCPVFGHVLDPVLHYGEYGTGFLMCDVCGGIADDPAIENDD